MNKNAVQKIVLLALAAILLCVYILQVSVGGKSRTQTLTLKEEVTSITIYTGSDSAKAINVTRDGDKYTVSNADGSESYDAMPTASESLFDSIREMHILGNAARLSSSNEERFGLDANSRITVQAKAGDKMLRSLQIGKNSSTGSQSYLTIDDSSQILISSSSLHTIFSVTMDSLRSKDIYSVPEETITQISVDSYDGSFTISKSSLPKADAGTEEGQGMSINESQWTLTGSSEEGTLPQLDQDAANEWAVYVSTLNASSWVDEKTFNQNVIQKGRLSFISNGITYSLQFFEIDGDENQMLCSSNITPYRFYLSKYTAQKFLRKLSDISSGGEND